MHLYVVKLSLAQELFKQMKEKKFKLNVVTYTILIKGAFNDYNIPLAKQLFNEMISSKIEPNVRTHNAYLGMHTNWCDKELSYTFVV